jgi:site-specific recombinase XerD
MPVKLSTTVNKIPLIVNSTNEALIKDFYEYLKNTGASEKHINNNLKAMMNFANHIDPNTTFFDVQRREQIIKFLDTKIKTIEEDPDARWITTWNHYLSHIKYFFRWLYNEHNKKNSSISITDVNDSYYYCPSSYYYDWLTPSFIQIRKKKTKRTSPYLHLF